MESWSLDLLQRDKLVTVRAWHKGKDAVLFVSFSCLSSLARGREGLLNSPLSHRIRVVLCVRYRMRLSHVDGNMETRRDGIRLGRNLELLFWRSYRPGWSIG